MKRIALLLGLPVVLLLLSSWGWVGHQIISSTISTSFTGDMEQFTDWVDFLADHASDADWRKGDDPTEGPKHYIDIDNYPEFLAEGAIHPVLDTNIARHGAEFVQNNGYLPWATLDAYNTLVAHMKDKEWEEAKIVAADLGHYVADGFMPMHITRNYNGQFTGHDGIHFRYESDMINKFEDEISYEISPSKEIQDVESYVFSYLYKNYKHVEDVLLADEYAIEKTNGEYNELYLDALWEFSTDMTIDLFRGASQAFANLIHSAWIEAGKPIISEETSSLHVLSSQRFRSYPNPFTTSLKISIELRKTDSLHMQMLDARGRVIREIFQGKMEAGMHELTLKTGDIEAGTYFLIFKPGDGIVVRRIIKN